MIAAQLASVVEGSVSNIGCPRMQFYLNSMDSYMFKQVRCLHEMCMRSVPSHPSNFMATEV